MALFKSSQSKVPNCSSAPSYMHDEFVELLWDNGPVINSQSNKTRKTSIFTPLDSKDNPYPKIGHFSATEPNLNISFLPSGSLAGFGNHAQDDDNVPWLNYSTEDNDFCSEFMNDFSGVNLSSIHSVPNASERSARIWPSQPNVKSDDMGINIGTSSQSSKQNGGIGVMNFSHFSKPGALARSNPRSVDRLENNNNATVVEPPSDSISSLTTPQDASLVGNSRKGIDESAAARVQISSFAENDKGSNEAVAALSSGCSGNSKPNHREGVESGYQSEDAEDESASLKISGSIQGNSKKRSRAAEVHNLSERRRRDRINERMRMLQELIPHCNKTDKASMLDEAIEYLKSLQMQLQVMSMGSALCIPQMMIPHARAPFSPMSLGMGMGMGLSYGMGMYDTNGAPSFSPVPSIQRVPGPNSLHMFGISGQASPVPMPYGPPFTSAADTRPGTVAAANSENHHYSKVEDPQIQ